MDFFCGLKFNRKERKELHKVRKDVDCVMKPKALALMGAASFCAGVRHKRYSGQQETAPENHLPFMLKSNKNLAVS